MTSNTIHRFPWGDDPDNHTESMSCVCFPKVDFQVEGADRQLAWVIQHSRLRERAA